MKASGQLHATVALPPRKGSLYPSDKRLGGTQSRSGRGDEEKNSQPLPGIQPRFIKAVAQSYATELSRLLSNYMNDKNIL
jgi:hypothetical protein